MRVSFLIQLFIFSVLNHSIGQVDSNLLFSKSKGHWNYPLDEVKNVNIYGQYKGNQHSFGKGMTFFSKRSSVVKSVYQGKLVKLLMADDVYLAIIKFGRFFISYSGIINPKIKEGDIVNAGQEIGDLGIGLDGNYVLEISLYKDQEEIDPASWFSQKSSP